MPNSRKGKRSPKRPDAIDLSHKAEIDFSPLELFLACLVDGHATEFKPREGRIRDAHKEITGKLIRRIDEPDSDLSQKLFQALLFKRQNMDDQLSEAEGGPVVRNKADEKKYSNKTNYALATEIFGEGSEELDGFYKRLGATYRTIREVDRAGYEDALYRWASNYDEQRDMNLFEDMKAIAKILQKHGIQMNLDRPFWRLEGKARQTKS